MKTIYIIAILTLCVYSSCNFAPSYEGKYIKLLESKPEYNFFAFDFDESLDIQKSGSNYVLKLADQKMPAKLEDNILRINEECTVFKDEKENVLVRSCMKGANTQSSDFWTIDKVNNYLEKSSNTTNYRGYIDTLLYSIYKQDLCVVTDDMSSYGDYAMENFIKTERKTTPNYPYIAIGDFNGDNKKPDIAVLVGKRGEKQDMMGETTLIVFHAGYSNPYVLRERLFGDAISTVPKQKLASHWEGDIQKLKGDGISSVFFEKSGVVYYWNGYNYVTYQTSD